MQPSPASHRAGVLPDFGHSVSGRSCDRLHWTTSDRPQASSAWVRHAEVSETERGETHISDQSGHDSCFRIQEICQPSSRPLV